MTDPIISIIVPPKAEAIVQLQEEDRDIYLGPLVLEQVLRNNGFTKINNYNLSREFNGRFAFIPDYNRSQNFEETLYGHKDLEECIASCVDKIDDSDLYIISINLVNHTSGLKLAQRLKQEHRDGKRKNRGFIFVGGPSIAETTERILIMDEIDATCYGYGEDIISQIAHFVRASLDYNIKTHELSVIPNLYVRGEDSSFHATEFVLPNNFVSVSSDLLRQAVLDVNVNRLPVIGAYGCEWCACNYCFLSSKPKHYHKRDIRLVVQDIETAVSIEGIHAVDILDEGFLYRIDKFLDASNKAKVPNSLIINARPNQILSHSELLERLIREFRGEVIGLYMGGESFDQSVLSKFNRGVTAKETMEATKILRNIASKYRERFNFTVSFFLWAVDQTVEGLLKGIELWEQATGGEVSPADLLKIQRYNIFSYSSFAEKIRGEFDNEMSRDEKRLAVMYPYGRAVFRPLLMDVYEDFLFRVYPKIPLPPHKSHHFRQAISPEFMKELSGYGKRLLKFPYETALRLHLKKAPQKVMNTVLEDMSKAFDWVITESIDEATYRRITTKGGAGLLKHIIN